MGISSGYICYELTRFQHWNEVIHVGAGVLANAVCQRLMR